MLNHQYYDQNEENMIKGLDDDEIEFLDLVDRTKIAADRKKELEEEKELNDYRNRVATLHEKAIEERLKAEKNNLNKPKPPTNRTSQQKLLKGIVVNKIDTKKRKNSDSNEDESKQAKLEDENSDVVTPDSGLKCVAILPGLGCYNDSSSDENSSDSEVEEVTTSKMDILGRKIVNKGKQQDS